MFKKIISTIVAVCLSLGSVAPVYAVDLGSSFDSLLQGGGARVSSGGQFNSQARNAYIASGASVRFPAESVTLFSVQPPKINAGCGGIDAHFGGFSFVNSSQIEQFIRNIAQNSIGLVIKMVIIHLCPQCDAVISSIEKLAQFASKMSRESCDVAQMLVGNVADKLGVVPPTQTQHTEMQQECGIQVSAGNGGPDFLSAIAGVCKSAKEAWAKVDEKYKNLLTSGSSVPAVMGQQASEGKAYNSVWSILISLGMDPNVTVSNSPGGGAAAISTYRDRGDMLLLMNMVQNSYIDPQEGSKTGSLPKIDGESLVITYMCGFEYNSTDATLTPSAHEFCTKISEKKPLTDNTQILICSGNSVSGGTTRSPAPNRDEQAWRDCKQPVAIKIGDIKSQYTSPGIFTGRGFLYRVEEQLNKAISDVRNDRPVSAETIALVNSSTLPVYQAINTAALYPVASAELIKNISRRYATLAALGKVEEIFKKARGMSATTTTNPALLASMSEAFGKIRGISKATQEEFYLNYQAEEALAAQIRTLNRAIQENVITSEILYNQRYANTITTATQGGSGGQTGSTTTPTGSTNTPATTTP